MSPPAVMTPVDRWLLPGALIRTVDPTMGRGRERPARTPRDWLVDAVLFLGALAVWFSELDNTVLRDTYGMPWWLRVADAVVGLLLCGSLWWRRRAPLALAVAAVLAGAFSNTASGALLILLFSLALHRGWVQAGGVIVASLPLGLPWIFTYYASADEEDPLVFLVLVVLLLLLTAAVGLVVRARRQLVYVLRLRAEEQRREYERRLVETRNDERRRIAREMHDTLAHRISLLTVHAGALEYRTEAAERGDAAPLTAAEVHSAVRVMREAAHAAVEELREVLQVLRRPEEAEAGDGTEPPQPGTDRIPALVEEARAGGQSVTSTVEGEPATLRAPVQRTVYRVVQEGLTNARKHAPGSAVAVLVRVDEGVTVEVANPAGEDPRTAPGAGMGLTGLAERVALHSGTLTHTITDGRFLLRATIPGGV